VNEVKTLVDTAARHAFYLATRRWTGRTGSRRAMRHGKTAKMAMALHRQSGFVAVMGRTPRR